MSVDRAVRFCVTCVTPVSLAVTPHHDDSSESGGPPESGHWFIRPHCVSVCLVTLLLTPQGGAAIPLLDAIQI